MATGADRQTGNGQGHGPVAPASRAALGVHTRMLQLQSNHFTYRPSKEGLGRELA